MGDDTQAEKLPPEFEDPPGPKLLTLGDVQRELARLYRRMHTGKVPSELAGSLTNCLTALAKVMQDKRDHRWTSRLNELWAKHEAENAQPAAPH